MARTDSAAPTTAKGGSDDAGRKLAEIAAPPPISASKSAAVYSESTPLKSASNSNTASSYPSCSVTTFRHPFTESGSQCFRESELNQESGFQAEETITKTVG